MNEKPMTISHIAAIMSQTMPHINNGNIALICHAMYDNKEAQIMEMMKQLHNTIVNIIKR